MTSRYIERNENWCATCQRFHTKDELNTDKCGALICKYTGRRVKNKPIRMSMAEFERQKEETQKPPPKKTKFMVLINKIIGR